MVKDNIFIKFSNSNRDVEVKEVEFNANKIMNTLAEDKKFIVLLNDSNTISDTNQIILQLIENLYKKERVRYEYTPQHIYWGNCLDNRQQLIKGITYCLSIFRRYE